MEQEELYRSYRGRNGENVGGGLAWREEGGNTGEDEGENINDPKNVF